MMNSQKDKLRAPLAPQKEKEYKNEARDIDDVKGREELRETAVHRLCREEMAKGNLLLGAEDDVNEGQCV
jgi:hypothetical protein